MDEHIGLVIMGSMVVVLGAIVPAWMYFKNYKNIRGRYWGRNRKYLRDHLIGNIVICTLVFILIMGVVFGGE